MKLYLTLGVCGIFAALLISGFVYQSFAADLSATLIPDRDRSEASYVGVKTVTLDYPAGSAVAQKLDGKNERFEFTLNGTALDKTAQLLDKTAQLLDKTAQLLDKTAQI